MTRNLTARAERVRGLRSGTKVPKARAARYGLPRKPSSASASTFMLAITRGVRICVRPKRYCQCLATSWNSGEFFLPTVSEPRVKPRLTVVMPPNTSCTRSMLSALAV